MLVLAIDTTTRDGSLALARDGELLDCWSGDASLTHARRLPGDILDGLGRHGLALRDITLFGVAAGPGSFTGLRIGIATIQGLAFAHDRPVVGVSVLDALAYAASPANEGARIAAWMDAQRQEVFACLYEALPRGGGDSAALDLLTAADLGELRIVAGPQVGFPAEVLAQAEWAPAVGLLGGGAENAGAATTIWVGDGAIAYRPVIEEAAGRAARVVDPVPPLAPAICAIAARRAALGLATTPHAVRPVYIRRPDAELARDRRQAGASTREGA